MRGNYGRSLPAHRNMAAASRRLSFRTLLGVALLFGLTLTILAAVTVQSEPAIPFDGYGHVILRQGTLEAALKVTRNVVEVRKLHERPLTMRISALARTTQDPQTIRREEMGIHARAAADRQAPGQNSNASLSLSLSMKIHIFPFPGRDPEGLYLNLRVVNRLRQPLCV